MAKYKRLERDNGVIINDRWRLVPCKGKNIDNWELFGLRDGTWRGTGRFYQYNTVRLALRYVIEREREDGYHESADRLVELLGEYERIVERMETAIKTALEAANKG